ncbi:flagellar motor switch protein FliM [Candidatus Bodocaedibacter vickermanii]|uniref:Flagellar motor switch protein FliM n=1 Tax=Candidatus Bodocaedibacter vickermanii TaxID=2741701 RepID=A0A7L9RT77_9PROT|nr:Flagellar motor switch protein FliM [Candidatus Paracaedibacteraceae bacterium 'Lake Konstanz']
MAKDKNKGNDQSEKEALSEEELQLRAFQEAIDRESAETEKELQGAIKASEFLQQDSIDQMFEDDASSGSQGAGAKLLLHKNNHENTQFPILDIVFDKFVQFFSTSASNFLQNRVEIVKLRVHSLMFQEYLENISLPALFNVYQIVNWESKGIVTINNSLTYSLINVLLGGKKNGGTQKEKIEGRTFSKLETNIVERFVSLALQDLGSAFAFIHPMEFLVERQESIPKLIGSIQQNALVSFCSFKFNIGDFEGVMDVVVPHNSLDPIREELIRKHATDEPVGKINNWKPYLTEKILQTDIEMSAVLLEESISLLDVLKWKPGTSIPIDVHQFDEVVLRVDNKELFTGKVGHQNSMVSIEIETVRGDV